MDGRTVGWMDILTNERAGGWTGEWMERWTKTDEQIDVQDL